MRTVYFGINLSSVPLQSPTEWQIKYWSRDFKAAFDSERVPLNQPIYYLDGIIRGVNIYIGVENIGISMAVNFDIPDGKTYVIKGIWPALYTEPYVPGGNGGGGGGGGTNLIWLFLLGALVLAGTKK